jgi:hypothetical protein
VTASEFAFLALGLVLGAASGAALIEVLRSRPPARREIRVTVAPNSIPRRATTLAEGDSVSSGPARGGPADRRGDDRNLPPPDDPEVPPGVNPIDPADPQVTRSESGSVTPPDRTPVPSASTPPPFMLAGAGMAGGAVAMPPRRPPIGIAIAREPDPMVVALRATAAATASAAMRRTPERGDAAQESGGGSVAGVAVAAASAEADTPQGADPPVGGGPVGPADAAAVPTAVPAVAQPVGAPDDACADQRRVADERCAVAARARAGATAAQETLRTNQRAYDDLVSSAEAAAAAADPRAVRASKESAQHAFRTARAGGQSRDDIEAAARDWLSEINRINLATREATATAEKQQRAAADIARNLERLSVEADAARISAEAAEEACVAAREAVAICQEAVALAAAGGPPAAAPEIATAGAPLEDESRDALATPMGSRAGEDAAIIRLLRGDRDVMTRIVATLGGDDEAERRRWQGLLGALIEALIARSIEASAFDFPLEHSFWTPFTQSQARDIAAALGSLGYRHDGFGGWADDHVPSQRDVSLAVGYAGLDPMRIRRWPSEAEMPDLLRDVTVAADEYVWDAAGGLTLGELVSLLGRRADGLAELWNEWGNVRPLLLSAD